MPQTYVTKQQIVLRTVFRLVMITIGAFIYAVGLEGFLIPNMFMDGGVVGISIILSRITGIALSIFIILLNIPFLIFAYKKMGKQFTIFSLYGIIILSSATALLHHIPAFTDDLLLATIFGGGTLGVGLGFVIRFGGAMDGSEILGVVLDRKLPFSTSDIIFGFNIIVFSAGAFLFGAESAMYSVVAFVIATRLMNIVEIGLGDMKAVHIISDYSQQIGDAIVSQMGSTVTYFEARGGYSAEKKLVIYTIIPRLQEAKLKDLINEIDEYAFVSFSDVNEVKGRMLKKKGH